MKKWLSNLKNQIHLTHWILAYVIIKAFFAPNILLTESLIIAIVLVVHYAKALVPKQKTLVSYDEDFFQEIKRLRDEVATQRTELNNLKLAAGILKSRPVTSDR